MENKPLYKIFQGQQLQIAEKIQQRRLQILIHSNLYYAHDKNIISDSQWDKFAMELVELQKKYPDISRKVRYADEFKDFDGSSGADLKAIREDSHIDALANMVWCLQSQLDRIKVPDENKSRIEKPLKDSQKSSTAKDAKNTQMGSQRHLF